MQLLPYMQSFFIFFKQLASWNESDEKIESLSATLLKIWSVLNHSVNTELRNNNSLIPKMESKSTADTDFLAYILTFLIEAVQLSSE